MRYLAIGGRAAEATARVWGAVSTPVVSVVVTTYNQCRYIRETLDSVLRQSYPDYEVIVVDDGSTDDTVARVLSFGRKVECIRQANQGPAGSRNTGIRSARGDFVALLDGDDVWEPTKLEAQVAAARGRPDSGLIAVDGRQVSEGAVLKDTLIPDRIRHLLDPAGGTTLSGYELLLGGNLIPTTSQVMIPRRVLEEIGPSDPAFRLVSDWDLYLRIAQRYPLTLLPEKSVRWRYLPTSASGTLHLRPLHWATEEISVLRKHLGQAPAAYRPLIRALLRRKRFRTAQTAYHSGRAHDRAWARDYLLRHLARNPTSGAAVVFLVALSLPQSLTRALTSLTRAVLGWPSVAPLSDSSDRPA